MPLSNVIRAEEFDEREIRPWSFHDLTKPMAETPARAESFRTAAYFRTDGLPREQAFTASFLPQPKVESAPPAEAPPPPAPSGPTPEELLAQARAELERARVEGEALRRKAQEEGRQAGQAAGKAEALGQVQEAARRLLQAAEAIQSSRGQVMAELEEELVQVVHLAATKVVEHELATNPLVIAHVLRQALSHVSQTRWLRIRLNPDDVQTVEELKSDLLTTNPDLAKVELVPDPEVGRGGCLVTTESEEIDATIDSRLAGLAQVLQRALQGVADHA